MKNILTNITLPVSKHKMTIKAMLFSMVLASVIFGIGCEKTIEIDLEDAKIRIVVNSEINPDSTFSVNITRSRHILDNAEIVPLSDAEVKLYEDDVLIGSMTHQNSGNYSINYKPKTGKTYKVTVSQGTLDSVFGTTIIPEKVQFISIDTTRSYDEYNPEMINFSIKFNDPAAQKNYYMISLRNRYSYNLWDPDLIVSDTLYVGPDTTIVHNTFGGYRRSTAMEKLSFSSDDMIVDAFIYQKNCVVFCDELIDGRQYSVKLRSDQYGFYSDTNMVYVDFYSISPEYYKYMISFNKHQDATGDPFSEPVMVFSNIVNGIGIFASSNVYTDSIQIINKNNNYYEY